MDEMQLLTLLGALNGLSERLAMEGRTMDAAVVAGAHQTIRALRTQLGPPPLAPVEPQPAPEVVSEGG